jgi:hypothetical protein
MVSAVSSSLSEHWVVTGCNLKSLIDIVIAVIAALCGILILAAIMMHVVARCGKPCAGGSDERPSQAAIAFRDR